MLLFVVLESSPNFPEVSTSSLRIDLEAVHTD